MFVAIYGLQTLEGRPYKTLVDAWNFNLEAAKNKPFLGHRPILSTDPLKFANEYVWETYGEIDVRMRNVGSGLEKLFRDGKLGRPGELETVGLWMANRPGKPVSLQFLCVKYLFLLRMAHR